MRSAHRYFLVEWIEDSEEKSHRFSMSAPALAFILSLEEREIESKLTRITGKV
jgi:hypothetical protein